MQPWLTGSPIEEVSGVEWIAIRLPPVQPWIACGETADSARMQHPYGPVGSPVDSRSVTANRPVGVGARRTADRDRVALHHAARIEHGQPPRGQRDLDLVRHAAELVADSGIHPSRLLPASVLTTPSHEPETFATSTKSGDPNPVRSAGLGDLAAAWRGQHRRRPDDLRDERAGPGWDRRAQTAVPASAVSGASTSRAAATGVYLVPRMTPARSSRRPR